MSKSKRSSRREELKQIKERVLREEGRDPFRGTTPAVAEKIRSRMARFRVAWEPIAEELKLRGFLAPALKRMDISMIEQAAVQECLVAGLLETTYPNLNRGVCMRLGEVKRSLTIQRGMLSNIERMTKDLSWTSRERDSCASIAGQVLFSRKLYAELGPAVLTLVRASSSGEGLHWLLKTLGKAKMDVLDQAELERFLRGDTPEVFGALFYALKNERRDVLKSIQRRASDPSAFGSKQAAKVLQKLS